MAFTDDDLKRLQAALLVASEFDDAVLNIKPKIVVALLARLEAAEAVCSNMNELIVLGVLDADSMKYKICKKYLDAWWKVAGK